MPMSVYMLRCADGSYYVGSTKKDVAARLWEHNAGVVPAYTRSRRPVVLVYAQEFDRFDEGCAFERRLKGWARQEGSVDSRRRRQPQASRAQSYAESALAKPHGLLVLRQAQDEGAA